MLNPRKLYKVGSDAILRYGHVVDTFKIGSEAFIFTPWVVGI